MTELRIRNIDDWIVDQHRFNAKKHGTSLEAELRRVLSDAALANQNRIADEIERHLAHVEATHGTFPSSNQYIRDVRDGRE